MSPLERGSILAPVNLFIAAILVLSAAGWSFIQKGCHAYYQKEATALFKLIEEKETRYRNINGKYLPFSVEDSAHALKKLKIAVKRKYYNFSAEQTETRTLRITAYLKPEILNKWYLHNPGARLRLVYEKKEGQPGRLVTE